MRRLLTTILVITLVTSMFTGVAAAQSNQRIGGTVVVDDGERVNGLTAYASRVIIRGTVEGDLTAFAGRVVIEDGGEVTGRVRAFAGSVQISGTVGENAVVYAGQMRLTESGQIGGSFGVVGGGANIEGAVGGDATAVTGAVTLGSTGDVDGFLIYVGQFTDEGGAVAFEARHVSDLALFPSLTGPAAILTSLYALIADLFAGAVLLYAFPEFARDSIETTFEQPQRLALAGIAIAVAVPVASFLAALTIVGIPLALAGVVSYLILLWIGSIYGRYLVGAGILRATDREDRYLALLVGVVLMAILTLIPLLGPVLRALVTLAGMGAIALGLILAYTAVNDQRTGSPSL